MIATNHPQVADEQEPLRAELLALDAHLAGLHVRRAWLAGQLADGPAGAPAYGPAPSDETSVQRLLLASGAVLLGLAGVVFTGLAWAVLGPVGRVGVLLVLAVLLGGLSAGVRRRLAGAAAALAAVSAALTATAAYAVPPLWEVTWSSAGLFGYVACASAVLCACYALAARLSGVRSWSVAVGLAGSVGVVAAGLTVADLTDDVLGFTAATAGLFVLVALGGARVTDRLASSLVLVAAGGASLLSTTAWMLDPDRAPAYAVALLGWAGITVAARRLLPVTVAASVAGAVAAGLVAVAVSLVVGSQPWGSPSLPLATGVVVLVAVTAWVRAVPAGPAIAAAVVSAAGAVWVPALVGGASRDEHWVAYLGLLALAAAIGGWSPARSAGPALRAASWWSAGALASLAWLVHHAEHAFAGPVERTTLPIAGLLLLAGLGSAVTVRRRSGAWPPSTAVLLPGLVAALLPGALAAWPLTWDAGWSDAVVRTAVYTLIGAAVTALGARFRVAALVVAGEVAVAVCALAHLLAAAEAISLWVTLSVAGALLLGVGARWEWLRGRGAATAGWVGRMR